jgi:hypothetical protein
MTMLIIWLCLSSCRMIHDAAEMLCNENKISWIVCMSVLLTNNAESFSGFSLKLFTLPLTRCESTPSLKANWNKSVPARAMQAKEGPAEVWLRSFVYSGLIRELHAPVRRTPGMERLRHINPLNAELNPICQLLALLWAHPILHISRIRVK